uniref:PDEase domain-containing protein n=1 Tax=Tetraselmis chuii TaxID=63592 RepID=A0A7S1X2V9_9CHLO|mmetsp:Transcript_26613/g.47357  ORF Transcript_26613/g.47357 Transcript_26613/m.47357 type:complete len:283 (+) Transcript_26613:2-850(+)
MLGAAGLANLSTAPNSKQAQSVGLVSMVAAMTHDYGHPQVNNAFLVEEESAMALEFNNQAVAEHFALRETMKLLMDSDTNFLSKSGDNRRGGLDEADTRSARLQRKRFRGAVIQIVLATDMSRHFELLSQFETQIVQNRDLKGRGGASSMWAAMNDAQRMLVLQIAMKVADIGHCALPMDVHRVWVHRLETEFFLQGDREKEAGLPVSPLMDRKLLGATAPENQVGFFKVIVLPLLRAWTEVFPSSSPLLEQAEANLSFYSTQVATAQRQMSVSIRAGKRGD